MRAIDVTLSVPKSVSLLWAFGTPETSAVVSIAVVEATETALRVPGGAGRVRTSAAGRGPPPGRHRRVRGGDVRAPHQSGPAIRSCTPIA